MTVGEAFPERAVLCGSPTGALDVSLMGMGCRKPLGNPVGNAVFAEAVVGVVAAGRNVGARLVVLLSAARGLLGDALGAKGRKVGVVVVTVGWAGLFTCTGGVWGLLDGLV